MKILNGNNEPIELKSIEQGAPFYYGNSKTLYMKVSTISEHNCHVNAVELKTGTLVNLFLSELVTPAHVHIEDD